MDQVFANLAPLNPLRLPELHGRLEDDAPVVHCIAGKGFVDRRYLEMTTENSTLVHEGSTWGKMAVSG